MIILPIVSVPLVRDRSMTIKNHKNKAGEIIC